ncbi:hypothetical protein BDV34DRAFT_188692 [Aspergillus parasiticus]|uniref:Heterokaryon incompatibility domain-containing protein n=1 Tax=Aspergillus parasiticus TaxID=5067 RepID=A0A5N6DWT8_ASPPA|nr:hypothetical protein BDV34DRAFT_188692 [Aspergillus parasiticus]
MQQVYTNCILNISLANAESPTKGYLEQDTNEIFFPFVVTIPDNGFGPRTSRSPINPRHWGNRIRGKLGEEVHDDKKGRRFLVIEENFVDRNLVSLPINGRAWVLQERFLSPRVLSLGHGQAFWNCRELSNAFESFPSSLREGDFHLSSRERFWPQSGQKLHEQEFFWNGMIQQYTSRRLTFPAKDRLVAFSAMAQRMAAFINSEYIAGHFWKQLPQSLPWQVIIHPESRPRRRDRYLLEDGRQIKTPSWSWASIDGEIQMPLMSVALYSTESIANMVDFTLDLVNDANPYGQVVSASLILQACCAEAQWTGGVPVLSGQPIKLHDYTSCNGYNVSFWWIIDDPIDELQEGDRCEVIALCRAESNQNLYGLIARRLPDRGPDSYARIGHFCMKGSIEVCRSLGLWHGEKKKITLV